MKNIKGNFEGKYVTNDKYVLREIAGENILVSVGEGVADFCGIVKLNPAAKVIWERLQKGASAEDLVNSLIEMFDVSRDQAAEDVEKSLELLKSQGMITYG